MTVPRCVFSLALALTACFDLDAAPESADDPPGTRATAQAVATTGFTDAYIGQGPASLFCNTPFAIAGQEPADAGRFPVFVYMVGTTELFNNASASAAVAGMASRGFVAATVAYDTATFAGCRTISGKARCIFDPGSATSAIARLCARAKADCSRGVLVGGFSQGAVMATLAKNFDPRVQAAWGMGDGVQYAIFDLRACMADGNRALPSSRLRAIDGEHDIFLGPTADNVRRQLVELTGLSCGSTAFSCLQGNGSGWYIVQDPEVQDRSADHCYMRRVGDCLGSQNLLDQNWLSAGEPWTLEPNLDWLASFAL